MLNCIWLGLVLASVLIGGASGRLKEVADGAIKGAETAVTLALGLIGVMTVWLGIMRLAEQSGFVRIIARALRPALTRLFPEVPANHPAMGETQYITMKTGDVLSLPFMADATIEYYINAICDDDCVNVDLAALEADGTEADVDDADDPSPVLNLQASEYRSPAPLNGALPAGGSVRPSADAGMKPP